jgi:hypothetical protein
MDFGDELNTVLTQPAEPLEGIETFKIAACDRYVGHPAEAIRCDLGAFLASPMFDGCAECIPFVFVCSSRQSMLPPSFY